MATVIPCIKGKFGNTKYYLSKMKARELITAVRAASETDEWATMGIEERMQRDPNLKRVISEITPYLVKNEERFFGSVIILIYKGEIEFETLTDLKVKLPRAYQNGCEDIGFITIDGGTLIILDGQHRILSIRKALEKEIIGKYSDDIPEDELSIIFINHESNQKTRRIFNKVNRYAKSTSRSDNLITSEDDGNAILARMLLDDGAPLGVRNQERKEIVDWKHNSLSSRSIQFTTLSVVYETVKYILKFENKPLQEHNRPSEEELDECYSIIEKYWEDVLDGINIYKKAMEEFEKTNSIIPSLRKEDSEYCLLFKPASQIALFKGLIMAKENGMRFKDVVKRANKINWSISCDIWKDIIVRSNGRIDAKQTSIDKAANLIAYLVSGDMMDEEKIDNIREMFNESRGNDEGNEEELPPYIKDEDIETA